MAKEVVGLIKLQVPAGAANPSPPIGPALGQRGLNIMDFCKAFNAKTSAKDQEGLIIPVVVTIYADRSYSFITICASSASAFLGIGSPKMCYPVIPRMK